MSKILLVEDEKRMAQALAELLRQEGYEVDVFHDGEEGMAAIENGIYDVAVLDIMLPGKDGFQIAKESRSHGVDTPILMLTARNDVDDKVKGLDSGADDYLTKPFLTQEFLARIRALNRRGSGSINGVLTFGDIELDFAVMSVRCVTTNESTRLSDKEYKILEYLISNKGLILTREQLALKIWGFDDEAEYNKVDVYMSFTRKKLAFVGSKTKIKAVRGVGYELKYDEAESRK